MTIDSAINRDALRTTTPADLRHYVRSRKWTDNTVGLATGYTQTNLVILPADYAFEFLLFATRNPRPCPIIDVTEIGSFVPQLAAPGADLRFDVPRYRVYEQGRLVEETLSIEHRWRDDLVGFLIGCSYTFEHALVQAGVALRHVQEGRNVPMFRTSVACVPAGRFHGPLVVSMRPIKADQVSRAVQITSRYPLAHGAPIWVGNPERLGIRSIDDPDWGESIDIREDETPAFWACGVTPQAVAMQSAPPLMITHAPGHMFVTDIPIRDLES